MASLKNGVGIEYRRMPSFMNDETIVTQCGFLIHPTRYFSIDHEEVEHLDVTCTLL